jgi:hypothetical protein
MKVGTDNRRQMILAAVVGVLALGACIYIYEELWGGGSTPPPAAEATAPATVGAPVRATDNAVAAAPVAVAGRAVKPVGTASSSLDPTLHMEAMLVSEQVVYAGNGRNIFSPNSAPPVVIQKPIAPARNPVAVNTPPPQPQIQAPPPIDLKFFGFETSSSGRRQAFLLHNDDVYLASAGDIVLRRYRIVTIDLKTIQVEDMQNKNTQTLPLLTN